MRPVMHGDMVAAARVLLGLPAPRRPAVLARMLQEARWADAYRIEVGALHPFWGDGSLMTAALNRRPGPEPRLSDRDYCGCLVAVLEALVARSDQLPRPVNRRGRN